MLDLNELVMFVKVVRAGSFSAAARELDMPANTLSRRISQLEARLQTRLLHRSTRKLSVSVEGQSLFERCAPAVDQMLAVERPAGKRVTPSGSIRVAAVTVFFRVLPAMEWLTEFRTLYPQIRLEFLIDDTPKDLIAEGIDVAFRSALPTERGFTVLPLIPIVRSFGASPSYLAAHGTPKHLAELTGHHCLTISPSNRHRSHTTWLMNGPYGAEQVQVRGHFSANDIHVLLGACIAGFGIALLPELWMTMAASAGQLVRVLPEYRQAGPGLNLGIVFPARASVSPAVSVFVEFFQMKIEGYRRNRALPSPVGPRVLRTLIRGARGARRRLPKA